jgi:protein-S-isoprenylcysteine O-methyltransferase Ste14
MEKRLSRFGIGPRVAVPSAACALAAWWATRTWPAIFSLPLHAGALGAVLLALGLLMWLSGVVTVMRAYNRDELVTSGVFALVRHPVYAGWITLGFPGLALLARSWLILLSSVVGYIIFKSLIHREDEYLEQRFGQAYLDYRGRVNELIAIPRFWR